jgi:hypothetical protein
MRRVVICGGVLGGGTALVFALAAVTATLFPSGTVVNASWNGGMVRGGWVEDAVRIGPPGDMGPAIFVAEPGGWTEGRP